MPKLIPSALAVLALAAIGCAPTAGPAAADGPRQCFFVSQANGFQAEDERTVYVNVGARDVYQLEMFGSCPGVDWSQRVGIAARGGGSSICTGQDAEIVAPQPGSGEPYRCQVRTVRKLSEAEAAARS